MKNLFKTSNKIHIKIGGKFTPACAVINGQFVVKLKSSPFWYIPHTWTDLVDDDD